MEAARRIRFKMRSVVDLCKVAEFVALIDPSSGPKPANDFRLLSNKGKLSLRDGSQSDKMFDIPDRIIGHLTSVFGKKMHTGRVAEVISGPFEVTSIKIEDHPKEVAHLDDNSTYLSDYRNHSDDIPHMTNN
jgi:hypothetical protein